MAIVEIEGSRRLVRCPAVPGSPEKPIRVPGARAKRRPSRPQRQFPMAANKARQPRLAVPHTVRAMRVLWVTSQNKRRPSPTPRRTCSAGSKWSSSAAACGSFVRKSAVSGAFGPLSRRFPELALECSAERVGGTVARALGHAGDAVTAATQQIPGERHAP
jgi:hypothetical protein